MISSIDPLVEIEPSVLERLDKTGKELRMSKLITSVDRYATKKISFESSLLGAPPLSMSNGDLGWILDGDTKKLALDQQKVQQVLDRISGNRIRDYVVGANIPAGQADGMTVTLGDSTNPIKRKFLFWKNGSDLYAKDLMGKNSNALLVDASIWEVLPRTRDFFKAGSAPTTGASAIPGFPPPVPAKFSAGHHP